MRKLLLIILLIIGFSYSQGINTSVIYLIENYNFEKITVDSIDVEKVTIDSIDVNYLGITNSFSLGSSSIHINDTFTQIGAVAHKSILSELTYDPDGTGTACPIAIVGKVNLEGNLTAANAYSGLGWGVQGQMNIVTGSVIDGSTYGSPGAVYAGLRGVVTDGSGNSTYTKGILTAVYAEIQMNQQNAEDDPNFDIYGIYIRNQGVNTSPDLTAGLYMDANVISGGANFEIGIDINDAVIGIDISDADTAIVIGEDGTPGGDFVVWGTGAKSTSLMWDDDMNSYGRFIINNASFRQYNLKSINETSMYVELQYDTTSGTTDWEDGGNIAISANAILNQGITNKSDGGYAESSGIKGAYTILGILDGDAINVSGVKGEIMGNGSAVEVDNIAAVSAKYNSTINPILGDNSLFWGWSEVGVVDYGLKLEATGNGSIGVGVLVVADTIGIKIDMETTDNDYTLLQDNQWTTGADMDAGGSLGSYSRLNIGHTVQNAIAGKSAIKFFTLADDETVNYASGFEATLELDDVTTHTLTVTDHLSALNLYFEGVGQVVGITEGGNYSKMNLSRAMWNSTANFDIETNGYQIETRPNSHLDYGFNVYNSGTMQAGLWIHNNTGQGGTMVYGINMASAGITDADFRLSNGALIYNNHVDSLTITESKVIIDGDLTISGDLTVMGDETLYGGMYMFESSATQDVRASGEHYAVTGAFGAGDLNGFTFVAGSDGIIASVATIDEGDSTAFTDSDHGLTTGDFVTISSANHSGAVEVVVISSSVFHTGIDFVGDETGTWQEGDYLEADVGTTGKFLVNLGMTVSAGAAAKEYHFEPVVNLLFKHEATFEFTTSGNNHDGGMGGGIISISAGDRVWVAFEGQTDATNIAYYHGNLVLHKL